LTTPVDYKMEDINTRKIRGMENQGVGQIGSKDAE
jgi:hypothetical protein